MLARTEQNVHAQIETILLWLYSLGNIQKIKKYVCLLKYKLLDP